MLRALTLATLTAALAGCGLSLDLDAADDRRRDDDRRLADDDGAAAPDDGTDADEPAPGTDGQDDDDGASTTPGNEEDEAGEEGEQDEEGDEGEVPPAPDDPELPTDPEQPSEPEPTEPNEPATDATVPAMCNGTVFALTGPSDRATGSIDAPDDVDCFVIDVPAGHVVEVTLTPTVDLDLSLARGTVTFESSTSGGIAPERIAYLGEHGQLAILVHGYEGAMGSYELTVALTADESDARTIAPGQTRAGRIHTANDVDTVSFTLTRTTIVEVSMTPTADLELIVVGPGTSLSSSSAGVATERIRATLPAGTYRVSVVGYGGAVGDYTVALAVFDD